MRQGRYVRYMIREATCLFIGLQAFVLIVGIYRLSQGPEAYDAYLAALWSPMGLLMCLAILVAAVIHSITWFNLTPKAMPLWIGDKQAPGWIIVGAHYGGWFVVSVAFLLLAGGIF
ncbi:Fumarate reductase, subunit C [Magnetospira sp. QH-2]|nr:Fumarate reductase, subunit C [Magnetospira sp. QH-2]